jgi:hypothetical protein
MSAPRWISAGLAFSGAVFAALAWAIPPFWPGYLVWIGWICIAVGRGEIHARWFWWISALWNLVFVAMLFSDTDWTLENKAWGYWHARVHSFIAAILSGLCLWLISIERSRPRMKAEPNQSHQHNAGDLPPINDSPESDTPSSIAPRG